MPRLPGISQKQAVRVFEKLGYRVVRESGHLILSNGERRLVIPWLTDTSSRPVATEWVSAHGVGREP